jgi:HK97 family phage major capsid protein
MLTYLRRLSDERNSLTSLTNTLSERAATEERDLTDAERAQLREWSTRCAELDSAIEEHNGQVASQRAWATLQSQLEADDASTVPQRRNGQPDPASASWAEQFTASAAFRNYSGRGSSEAVALPFETRAAITTGLYPLQPQFVTAPTPTYSTPLLSVINTERVSTGSVEWIVWGPSPAGNAAVVAEGELKPEALLTAVPASASLVTYAHWKAITRQALEDIPRIQSIIEGRLRAGLSGALEAAVAAMLNAEVAVPNVLPGASMLASIRTAQATVQAAGYTPNAVLLNPADWAAIDLALLDGTLNGPAITGSAFGLKFVSSTTVVAGEMFVGDFSTGVTLFDRGVADVYMTDSHADYFLRNQLVILAETRALPVIVEPLALAHVKAA